MNRPVPSPNWIAFHAEAYGRAVELAHERYRRIRPDDSMLMSGPAQGQLVDAYVEYGNWITAVRRLCRVAASAKALHDPMRATATAAAVDEFEKTVRWEDATHVRDVLEHADKYAAGIGQTPIRFSEIDMDAWTAAAQKFCADLCEALKP